MNVLKVHNFLYQTNQVGIVYSDFYWYNQENHIKKGYNKYIKTGSLKSMRRTNHKIRSMYSYSTKFLLNLDISLFKRKDEF